MSDGIERLEAELGRMRPAGVRAGVVRAIGSELGGPPAWRDWTLLGSMVAGCAAAVVIAALVVADGQGGARWGGGSAAGVVPQGPGANGLAGERAFSTAFADLDQQN